MSRYLFQPHWDANLVAPVCQGCGTEIQASTDHTKTCCTMCSRCLSCCQRYNLLQCRLHRQGDQCREPDIERLIAQSARAKVISQDEVREEQRPVRKIYDRERGCRICEEGTGNFAHQQCENAERSRHYWTNRRLDALERVQQFNSWLVARSWSGARR